MIGTPRLTVRRTMTRHGSSRSMPSSFASCAVARLASIDAEDVLHGATEKFRRRFTEMEAELSAQGKSVENVPQAELEQAWEAAKAAERQR